MILFAASDFSLPLGLYCFAYRGVPLAVVVGPSVPLFASFFPVLPAMDQLNMYVVGISAFVIFLPPRGP